MRYPIEFYRNLELGQEVFYVKKYGVFSSKIEDITILEKFYYEEKTKNIIFFIKIKLRNSEEISENDYICLSEESLKEELFAFQNKTTG